MFLEVDLVLNMLHLQGLFLTIHKSNFSCQSEDLCWRWTP